MTENKWCKEAVPCYYKMEVPFDAAFVEGFSQKISVGIMYM